MTEYAECHPLTERPERWVKCSWCCYRAEYAVYWRTTEPRNTVLTWRGDACNVHAFDIPT